MFCVFREIHHFNMAEGRVSVWPRMCFFFFVCLNLGIHFVSWSGRSLCSSCCVNLGYFNEVVWSPCTTCPSPIFLCFSFPFLITKCSLSGSLPGTISLLFVYQADVFQLSLWKWLFLFPISALPSCSPGVRLPVFSSCELEDSWGWSFSHPVLLPLWTSGWPWADLGLTWGYLGQMLSWLTLFTGW